MGIRNLKISEKVISVLWSPNANKNKSKKNWVDLIIKLFEPEKISIKHRVTTPNGVEKSKIGIENPKIAKKALLTPTAHVNP